MRHNHATRGRRPGTCPACASRAYRPFHGRECPARDAERSAGDCECGGRDSPLLDYPPPGRDQHRVRDYFWNRLGACNHGVDATGQPR